MIKNVYPGKTALLIKLKIPNNAKMCKIDDTHSYLAYDKDIPEKIIIKVNDKTYEVGSPYYNNGIWIEYTGDDENFILEQVGDASTLMVINNLESNTQYTVRQCQVFNGEQKIVFEENVKTLIETNMLISVGTTYEKVDNYKYDDAKYFQIIKKGCDIMNSFQNSISQTMDITFCNEKAGIAATSDGRFYGSFENDQLESVFIHEMIHVISTPPVELGYIDDDETIEFLSWALSIPKSTVFSRDDHYYPINSSQRFTYIGDCINTIITQILYRNGYTAGGIVLDASVLS